MPRESFLGVEMRLFWLGGFAVTLIQTVVAGEFSLLLLICLVFPSPRSLLEFFIPGPNIAPES